MRQRSIHSSRSMQVKRVLPVASAGPPTAVVLVPPPQWQSGTPGREQAQREVKREKPPPVYPPFHGGPETERTCVSPIERMRGESERGRSSPREVMQEGM